MHFHKHVIQNLKCTVFPVTFSVNKKNRVVQARNNTSKVVVHYVTILLPFEERLTNTCFFRF